MKRFTRGALASFMVIGLAVATTACGDDDESPDVTVDLTTGSSTTVAGGSVTTMSPGSDSTTSSGDGSNDGTGGMTSSTAG